VSTLRSATALQKSAGFLGVSDQRSQGRNEFSADPFCLPAMRCAFPS